MTYLKGGYILVNKNESNIYESVSNALTLGKPILWYEDNDTCYYIDTISKSGDDIVITKGGKTITITDANVVTETGDISGGSKLYTHRINLVFLDGCSESKNVVFRVITSNKNAYDDTSFRTLFNGGSEDQSQYCGSFNNALIETSESTWAFGDLVYNKTTESFEFLNNVANNTYDISNLTLQTINDNVFDM